MTTPDLFASGGYVRASEAPAPGASWPQPQHPVVVNTDTYTLAEMSRAREANLSGMFGALDNKRFRAWDQYGYPEEVTFDALLKAYERSGAAHGAVHKLLDKCWQSVPRVKQPEADEETEWEKKTETLFKRIGVWRKLRDLDRRNMVGRYAAVIYRVKDGKELREPLVRGELVDLVPLYESQIQPTQWDADMKSLRYGQPVMYQYRARRPDRIGQTGAAGQPDEQVDVHWTRVQILAEGSVGDLFDGVPLLLAGFNALVDIEKVSGGSAEGFLKNSARTVTMKFDNVASLQSIASTPGQAIPTNLAEAIDEKVKKLNRNIDSALITVGGEAGTLQTQQISPGQPFEVAANLFAASVRIPFTILFGQQTGRLASDEDQADFNARAASRRENELTPMVEEFVRRMQACGAIDAGEFEVEWEPLDALSEDEQLANAKTMAEINEIQARAGQAAAFDGNEIRGVAHFEERDELADLPLEGDAAEQQDGAQAGPGAPPQQPPAQRPALRVAAS